MHKLSELASSWPELHTVYLATDYPLENIDQESKATAAPQDQPPPHSGTFAHELTEAHHLSMRELLHAFDSDDGGSRVGNLKLATYGRLVRSGDLARSLPVALQRAFPEDKGGVDLATIDAGLVGIMDKLVAIEADALLVGGADGDGACGKKSSFTGHIVQERTKANAHVPEGGKRRKIIVEEWRQP
jgi:hypothetical protein